MHLVCVLILAAVLAVGSAGSALSQELERKPPPETETNVTPPNPVVQKAEESGALLFLFGAFCALWAQNTGRSAWLWFFLGVFFSVVAVLFLLTKNSNDNFEKKKFGRTPLD